MSSRHQGKLVEQPTHGAQVERLTRLYAALSQVSHAVARASTRAELFAKVCGALVEHGGFRVACVAWYDPELQRLLPLGQAGEPRHYLESIELHIGESAEQCSPPARAFRDDRPCICNDFFEADAALPWRAGFEQRGFQACAAFPIHTHGSVNGALSVYADRKDLFEDREIALLTQTAADISFAIDRLAHEEARQQTEETLKRFVAIVESTEDAIVSKTLDGTITSWNPAAQRMFGYSSTQMIGRSIELIIPPERADDEPMILRRIKSGECIKQFETIRKRQDGTLFPVAITLSPIWGLDAQGTTQVVGVSKMVRDISERKQVEALAESEQRFATSLIEAMPSIFYLYDEQGHFLRWNRNFERVSGYSADEIAGMHPLDFFAPDTKALLQERIAEVFEKGEASVEAQFLAKDASVTPYFFTGRRISFEQRSCLIGVGVDITERKRAEAALGKSEERYRSTLENMMEGCQILGFDWRYLYLNPMAALHNRRPNQELLGQRMPDAWPGIEASQVFELLKRCMLERAPLHGEIEFAFADGSSGWFDVRTQPVPEGIFVLSIDISERKRVELALHELNERLESKVAERTRDLETQRERAEAADRIKSAFLATMSHELRTPLNSIIGFTGIVLRGLAGPLTAEQSKQLGMVQGSARHLLDLINDVLDISKIEAGQLEVRCAAFDLAASIERVTASVKPLLAKKDLKLQLSVPQHLAPMHSDRRRVEQILLNLLNNAIKFTDSGTVTLSVTRHVAAAVLADKARDTGAALQISVSDTGIGMKAEDLSKLFQPFRQIDSGLERQHEGTGLGLAICWRLTELLGGTLRVESVWGEGSVFSVVLPMIPASDASSA